MSAPLVLDYPFDAESLQPVKMKASTIWKHAAAIRRQLDPYERRFRIDVDRMIRRTRKLIINGRPILTHWECGQRVFDDRRMEVLGSTEFDPACPDAVMVYVNGDLTSERSELLRSTAAHEVAHVIYDVSSWLHGQRPTRKRLDYRGRRPALNLGRRSETDWREWRANEFMGALVVPQDALHKEFVKLAAAHEFRFVAGKQRLPAVKDSSIDPDRLNDVFEQLAELFGVSASFIAVRSKKYGLIE
jgi:Zn-dependent peptidase ImmA (M78 family)